MEFEFLFRSKIGRRKVRKQCPQKFTEKVNHIGWRGAPRTLPMGLVYFLYKGFVHNRINDGLKQLVPAGPKFS